MLKYLLKNRAPAPILFLASTGRSPCSTLSSRLRSCLPTPTTTGKLRYCTETRSQVLELLHPKLIVEKLNRHVIGQEEAKKCLAIALRDRWRRLQIHDEILKKEITPTNILLVGPSGCGKTELARRIAAMADSPFVKVVATKYTETGFVGDETASMIQELAERAFMDEKKRFRNRMYSVAKLEAEEYLVKSLKSMPAYREEDAQSLLRRAKSGELDDVEFEIEPEIPNSTGSDPVAKAVYFDGFGRATPLGAVSHAFAVPLGIQKMSHDSWSEIVRQLITRTSSEKQEKKIKVRKALPLLEEYFLGKLMNEEEINKRARFAVENRGIVFIDEFDKLADSKEDSEFKSKRRGVQKELLVLMEGATVPTRVGLVSTDHILFIASGAFTSSKPTDLMPELQGRLPVKSELKALTVSDLESIISDTQNSILKQQSALLSVEGITILFTPQAVLKIAQITHDVNTTTVNIGARRLKTVFSELLEDLKFNSHAYKGKSITIDSAYVEDHLKSLRETADISKYVVI